MLTLSEAAVQVQPEKVKVRDPFVRVFHWSLVAAFFGAYFLEGGDTAHDVLGYIALGLVTARIVWGFIGTQYARFSKSRWGWWAYMWPALSTRAFGISRI